MPSSTQGMEANSHAAGRAGPLIQLRVPKRGRAVSTAGLSPVPSRSRVGPGRADRGSSARWAAPQPLAQGSRHGCQPGQGREVVLVRHQRFATCQTSRPETARGAAAAEGPHAAASQPSRRATAASAPAGAAGAACGPLCYRGFLKLHPHF